MTSWSFLNPPSDITASDGRVSFKTAPKTDYWRTPARIAANGHFYHTKASVPVESGFHLQCSLSGEWKTTYDQGGIMIWASEEKWIKAGVEYVDGTRYLSYLVIDF